MKKIDFKCCNSCEGRGIIYGMKHNPKCNPHSGKGDYYIETEEECEACGGTGKVEVSK